MLQLPERVQASQVEELLAQFRQGLGDEPIEVDVSAVTKIDTAGVQLLASAVQRHGAQLRGHSEALLQAATVLGLAKLFEQGGGVHESNTGR